MENQVENFETYMDKIKNIVERLEQDELSLDESMALFEQGTQIYRQATGLLDEAKATVDVLLEDGEIESLEQLKVNEDDQ